MSPQTLDFELLARRVIENNMGIGGIRVEADVRIESGRVVFPATGQSFPLAAGTSAPDGPMQGRFDVLEFATPQKTTLKEIPTGPQAEP